MLPERLAVPRKLCLPQEPAKLRQRAVALCGKMRFGLGLIVAQSIAGPGPNQTSNRAV